MVYVADFGRKKICSCLDTYFFGKNFLCLKNTFWGQNRHFGKFFFAKNSISQNTEESSVKTWLKIPFVFKGKLKWPKWPKMAGPYFWLLLTHIFGKKAFLVPKKSFGPPNLQLGKIPNKNVYKAKHWRK